MCSMALASLEPRPSPGDASRVTSSGVGRAPHTTPRGAVERLAGTAMRSRLSAHLAVLAGVGPATASCSPIHELLVSTIYTEQQLGADGEDVTPHRTALQVGGFARPVAADDDVEAR
jgi:hypothetical protein